MACIREFVVLEKNTFVHYHDESAEKPFRRSVTLPENLVKNNVLEPKVIYHIRESRDVDQLLDNIEPQLLDLMNTPRETDTVTRRGSIPVEARPSTDISVTRRGSISVRRSANLLEFPGMPMIQSNRLEVGGPVSFNVVDQSGASTGQEQSTFETGSIPIKLNTAIADQRDEMPSFRASYVSVTSPRITMSKMTCPSELVIETAPSPKRDGQVIFEPEESSLDEFAQGIQLPEDQWTSLMIRNIPCRYTTSELLDEIIMLGFHIDFLYLPPARRSVGNLGYAFVNFVTAEHAAQFFQLFQGYSFSLQQRSNKRATIIYAKLQGFEANVDFYTKVKVGKKKNQPFIDHDAHNTYRLKSCGAQ
jgi:hypothetical protein